MILQRFQNPGSGRRQREAAYSLFLRWSATAKITR